MIGPWSSGVALAVSEVAKRKKVVHLFSGGTEDISGSRCHRYSFQWAASPYTAAKTVVDNFMKANPKAKRWHLLVADYAFGWSVEKYIKEVGKAHGIEFVGADRHPARRARVLQLRAEGRGQPSRRGGDDQLRRRRGRRRARDLQLRPDAQGAAHPELVLRRGGADPARARDPRQHVGRHELLLHRRHAGGARRSSRATRRSSRRRRATRPRPPTP